MTANPPGRSRNRDLPTCWHDCLLSYPCARQTDRVLGRSVLCQPTGSSRRTTTILVSISKSAGVLVVAAQPEDLLTLLVASHRCPVEQAVVAHDRLESARGGHVGPGDGAGR